ncbi:MAG: bifunctional folylpolyglutamate synthase/dihydrofolate synthase [Nitrospiraceae bacterium]|nr:bifunctional folylpolyglutamate synthase/dihydrofolate synthase [Nitrospiraceae bacterium]
MSYQETIRYLYGLQQQGMKFGLDNIRMVLRAAGDPQRSFRAVHVAGTNGKGSTAAMVESILRASGITTGLFTSPHLISFTERIRVNGAEIAEQTVIDLADEVREISRGLEDFCPTFFEVVTAMAFIHFRRQHVQWAVVETGLGGRLDATNTIMPEVSIITRVGLDHCEFLGNSLAEVAAEKAGIIKEGVPLVTTLQATEAAEVIERKAREKGSALFIYGRDYFSDVTADDLDGITLRYRGEKEIRDIRIPLPGSHQAANASMAAKAAELIMTGHDLDLDIRGGISRVRWPGRLETVKTHPPILIDGAHNPQAAAVLAEYLRRLLSERYQRIILVLGVMKDKDVAGILAPLLPCGAEIIFTAPAYGRAAGPGDLAAVAASLGFAAETAPTVPAAIARAEGLWRKGDLIVITGSFYTIGEAKEVLGSMGVLSRLRE